MIDVITDGDDITGLLYYLWGPGKANEHTNPHLVAGFRHPLALEPAVTDDGRREFRHLTATLNHPALPDPGLAYDLAATAFPMSIDQSVELSGPTPAAHDPYTGRSSPSRPRGPSR
jgi:hypothetical protein